MGSPVSLRISCICYDSCDALVIWLYPHRVVGHVNDVRDLRRNLANHDLEAIYFLVEQFLNDHAKLAVGPRSMPCRPVTTCSFTSVCTTPDSANECSL